MDNYPGSDEEDVLCNEDTSWGLIQKVDSTDIVYKLPGMKYKLVGPYIKGDLLGEGGYGKVKECLHSRTLERCAVKIMKHRNLRRIPNGMENVEREIALLRKLRHRNVIKLMDVIHCQEKKKIYIVMEYCVIGLQEMLENSPGKRFPSWQAHHYFLQLIDGLEYLHSKGIVHKDIKPGNLLLTTNSTLKIIDFGVAEQIDLLVGDDIIKSSQGSPMFQPPEVAGIAKLFSGFKVDVWSAGVTLYNMTSSLYPFEGSNIFALYRSIREDPVVIPADLDASLRSLLGGMLQKEPSQRFTLEIVKKHEWCLRRQPSLPDQPGVAITVGREKRSRYEIVDCIKNHFYEEEEDTSQQYKTEHEINEIRREAEQRSQSPLKENHIHEKPKRRKTVSCISMKAFPSCFQS